MAHRIGPTPQLSQPRGNSAEDVRGLALQMFKDSVDLRARLRDMLPSDGSEGMSRPLPLARFATVDLPNAALWEGSIVYDSTTKTVKWSNGTVWATI